MIFPACFHNTSLLQVVRDWSFQTLPLLFKQMLAVQTWCGFFLLLSVAALTSTISLLEVGSLSLSMKKMAASARRLDDCAGSLFARHSLCSVTISFTFFTQLPLLHTGLLDLATSWPATFR
jgi:SNF family Na+-dependent transporter